MSDEKFQRWMTQVDQAVSGICGLSVHDLSDQTFRDWFDDGTSPEVAAEMTLEDNGWQVSA